MTAIPELIATTLKTRLEAITTGNGYNFDVSEVKRVNRVAKDVTPRDKQIQIKQGTSAYNRAMSHGGNPPAIAYDVVYMLHCFVRNSDSDATASATSENDFDAAVKKSVCSVSDWYNFGGKAIIADWGNAKPYISAEGEHAGITIPLVVTYRVSETDPYTARN